MGKWVHRLSAVNTEDKIALCSECGPVRIVFKGYSRHKDKQRLYACREATYSRDAEAPSKNDGKKAEAATRRWRQKMYDRYPNYREPFMGDCPICNTYARLVFDHDHATDEAREHICALCNSMLGFAKDSPSTLLEAAIYLLKHKRGQTASEETA